MYTNRKDSRRSIRIIRSERRTPNVLVAFAFKREVFIVVEHGGNRENGHHSACAVLIGDFETVIRIRLVLAVYVDCSQRGLIHRRRRIILPYDVGHADFIANTSDLQRIAHVGCVHTRKYIYRLGFDFFSCVLIKKYFLSFTLENI